MIVRVVSPPDGVLDPGSVTDYTGQSFRVWVHQVLMDFRGPRPRTISEAIEIAEGARMRVTVMDRQYRLSRKSYEDALELLAGSCSRWRVHGDGHSARLYGFGRCVPAPRGWAPVAWTIRLATPHGRSGYPMPWSLYSYLSDSSTFVVPSRVMVHPGCSPNYQAGAGPDALLTHLYRTMSEMDPRALLCLMHDDCRAAVRTFTQASWEMPIRCAQGALDEMRAWLRTHTLLPQSPSPGAP